MEKTKSLEDEVNEIIAMLVDSAANSVRQTCSSYCVSQCNGLCCKSGITNTENRCQMELLAGGKREELEQSGYLKSIDGQQYVFFYDEDHPCPRSARTDDGKLLCGVHESNLRPKICREYPILIDHDKQIITIAQNCSAVVSGFLDDVINQELRGLGYGLDYSYKKNKFDLRDNEQK
jgi:Fe-S-cluster containining protein